MQDGIWQWSCGVIKKSEQNRNEKEKENRNDGDNNNNNNNNNNNREEDGKESMEELEEVENMVLEYTLSSTLVL